MEIRVRTAEEIAADCVTIEVNGARLYTVTEVGNAQVYDPAKAVEVMAENYGRARRRIEELEIKVRGLLGELAGAENRVASLGLELARRPSELKCCEEYGEPARVAVCGPACHEAHTYVPPCEQPAEMAQILAARDRLLATVSAERETERTRADQNRAWAERAESHVASLGLELADARREIEILSGQLGRVSGLVHSQDIQAALRTTWSDPNARSMFWALRGIRDVLGSPGPSASPGTDTSQA